MKVTQISIGKNNSILTAYIQVDTNSIGISRKRRAVLVLPGGGYTECADKECEPIAMIFAGKGYQVFTLKYSTMENASFPAPQVDASIAVAHIRKNYQEYFINPDQIVVVGLSAGGHLASSLGVMWDDKEIQKLAGVKGKENMPNALALLYPCITAGEYAHRGITNFLGKDLSQKEREELISCENRVSKNTPPCYVCHTSQDSRVSVMNPLLFCQSLAKNNILFDLHIFAKGDHGYSSGEPSTFSEHMDNMVNSDCGTLRSAKRFSSWQDSCMSFLDEVFLP